MAGRRCSPTSRTVRRTSVYPSQGSFGLARQRGPVERWTRWRSSPRCCETTFASWPAQARARPSSFDGSSSTPRFWAYRPSSSTAPTTWFVSGRRGRRRQPGGCLGTRSWRRRTSDGSRSWSGLRDVRAAIRSSSTRCRTSRPSAPEVTSPRSWRSSTSPDRWWPRA